MLRIKIGSEKGRIPAGWEDVSIECATWLQEQVKHLPPAVVAYYQSLVGGAEQPFASISPKDRTEWAKFAKLVISRFCGISTFGLGKVSEKDLIAVAQKLFPIFILGVLGYANPDDSQGNKFRFACKTYYYPISGLDITGAVIPFSGMSAIEFCTVSDLIAMNDLSVAPIIVAVCCHTKGHRYNEEEAMVKAKIFKKLPMSIYWHVWAAMNKVHEYMKTECPDCFPKTSSKDADGQAASWINTLMQLVADKPSELEYVQAMPCYDFIRLLSVNIRKQKEEWKIRSALRF